LVIIVEHVPPMQYMPAAHAFAHEPQCIGSVETFTHAPLHTIEPVGQMHVPPRHTLPDGHAMPQTPQFIGSVVRSRQFPAPQKAEGAAHVRHTPAEQYCDAPHARPHIPQLFMSVWGSTHAVPHASDGAMHVHAPITHV
jgi:hypothetical protein